MLLRKLNRFLCLLTTQNKTLGIFTDSVNIYGLKIFSVGKLKYNPRVISNGIAIKKNNPYRLSDRKKTYNFFNELQIFKYPSIVYKENKVDSTKLDARII